MHAESAPALIEWMVNKFVNWITAIRVLFVAVLVLQNCILAVAFVGSYHTTEKGTDWMWLLVSVVLILYVLTPWFIILKIHEKQLSKLWIVWSAYVATLMIFLCFIFGFRAKLDKNHFWGPNNLNVILCLTPFIAVLMVLTARDAWEYVNLNYKRFVEIVIEVLDTVEVLAIFISSKALSDGMVFAIVFLAVLSLSLSPLLLAEKLDEDEDYTEGGKIYLFVLVFRKLFVNLALFILRLVAWLVHKQKSLVSIFFIFKNVLMIGSYFYYIFKYVRAASEGAVPLTSP